jgi:hypothetical protein
VAQCASDVEASDAQWAHMTDEEKAEAWREAHEADVA